MFQERRFFLISAKSTYDEILTYLQSLPMTILAEEEEVLKFVENHQLMGKELGYIDIHLIASAVLTDVPLWTLDQTLDKIAKKISITYR